MCKDLKYTDACQAHGRKDEGLLASPQYSTYSTQPSSC